MAFFHELTVTGSSKIFLDIGKKCGLAVETPPDDLGDIAVMSLSEQPKLAEGFRTAIAMILWGRKCDGTGRHVASITYDQRMDTKPYHGLPKEYADQINELLCLCRPSDTAIILYGGRNVSPGVYDRSVANMTEISSKIGKAFPVTPVIILPPDNTLNTPSSENAVLISPPYRTIVAFESEACTEGYRQPLTRILVEQ